MDLHRSIGEIKILQAYKLADTRAGARHVFAVPQHCLNDYYATLDTREDAERNFEVNRLQIEANVLRALAGSPSLSRKYG